MIGLQLRNYWLTLLILVTLLFTIDNLLLIQHRSDLYQLPLLLFYFYLSFLSYASYKYANYTLDSLSLSMEFKYECLDLIENHWTKLIRSFPLVLKIMNKY